MIFFWAETPDGWGIPGIHGPFAEDELDGYVQSGVYLIRGKGESLLVDSGNWSLPEYGNGMGDFLVDLLDKEKNELKYIFLTHFHYDHVGNAAMLKKRYGAEVICHPLDQAIIEDPMIVTRPKILPLRHFLWVRSRLLRTLDNCARQDEMYALTFCIAPKHRKRNQES